MSEGILLEISENLQRGKAKVVKRSPFTIKLLYRTTNFVQPLTLGVDTGSGTFATAVCNEKCEILYTFRYDLSKLSDFIP